MLAYAAALLGARLKDGPRWRWLTVILAVVALGRSINYSSHLFRNYGIPEAYEKAFDWLERHAEPDSVVAALSGEVNLLLPVYTRNKTLVARNHPLVSNVTTADNARRLSYGLSLLVPPEKRKEAVAFFLNHSDGKRMTTQMWKGQLDRLELESYPSETLFNGFGHGNTYEEVSAVIREVLSETVERSYLVDYLWIGPFERRLQGGSFRAPPNYRQVYDDAGVSLFRREDGAQDVL